VIGRSRTGVAPSAPSRVSEGGVSRWSSEALTGWGVIRRSRPDGLVVVFPPVGNWASATRVGPVTTPPRCGPVGVPNAGELAPCWAKLQSGVAASSMVVVFDSSRPPSHHRVTHEFAPSGEGGPSPPDLRGFGSCDYRGGRQPLRV